MSLPRPLALRRAGALLALALAGCADAPPDVVCNDASTSTCRTPTQAASYYVAQGLAYFDTLDESADPTSQPDYAENVARWEWPPWLLLTGYGADQIEAIDVAVLAVQPGTTVPDRDCRAFDVQPFGRCRVVMDYQGKPCPIYEEFTFDDAGQMTFIEAWSDLPGLRPTDDPDDPWAEGDDVHRLSTRLPGLGSDSGRLDPTSPAMAAAAAGDPEIADFVARTQDFWGTWGQAFAAAGDDLYERGCGWTAEP